MRTTLLALLFVSGISGLSCTRQEARSAVDGALSIAQISCVETSALTDEDAVALACGIVQSPILKGLLHMLVGSREAAKRSGFAWPAQDGGLGGKDAGRD